MKVRVIKTDIEQWYYDHIGEIFEVKDEPFLKDYYLLRSQSYETIRGFRISDVEVVKDIPDELFEMEK